MLESDVDLPLGEILSITCTKTVAGSLFKKTTNITHKFVYMNFWYEL